MSRGKKCGMPKANKALIPECTGGLQEKCSTISPSKAQKADRWGHATPQGNSITRKREMREGGYAQEFLDALPVGRPFLPH